MNSEEVSEKVTETPAEAENPKSLVVEDSLNDTSAAAKKSEDTKVDKPVETVKMASTKSFEPPAFISKLKSYSAYKADLKRWSRISNVDKKLQAEVIVYSLDGHPSRIKDKIDVKIGDELIDNEKGIEVLLNYLDTIYQEDEMCDAWTKYKNFQKVSRGLKQDIPSFISDFSKFKVEKFF